MSAIEDGGPAFPVPNDAYNNEMPGMTLRDWLAGMASDDDVAFYLRVLGPKTSREQAKYTYADAMLAARKEGA